MIVLAIIALSIFISAYLYPNIPENMASHWNIKGEVDAYAPKLQILFLFPLISIILLIIFIIIPRIDPLKKNISKFRRYYDWFLLILILFLFYVHTLVILWNVGFRFNIIQFLTPAFAFLFYYLGILTENTKRNWFIGIRTPWTMSSDRIWNKTHKTSGKLFKLIGIISFLGILFYEYALIFIFIPIFLVAIYATVYSYLEFKKTEE
ncbi:MAG: SdpI family protein [Candidatus Parvarchaeota archaeon]|nr:SdpI family protein [Candidatus Jingweiarchaeum tengchongense]MCW1298079.1 SdpI family protein [Candidatus Jingweiarchaeum tengchongense]